MSEASYNGYLMFKNQLKVYGNHIITSTVAHKRK